MKIGVFGGRFDPVHIGHLILAQDVLEHAKLDKILFLLSYSPPHKNAILSYENRLKLLDAALEKEAFFETCTIEKTLNLKKAYTAIVLEELSKKMPHDDLYFIMGEDQFMNLSSWYMPHKIFEFARVIVLKRYKGKMQSDFSDDVLYVNRRIIEISSTEIRERIKKGLPITYLVPQKVEEIIKREGFYK